MTTTLPDYYVETVRKPFSNFALERRKRLLKTLELIEEVTGSDPELFQFVLSKSKKKRPAGKRIEVIFEKPHTCVRLMSHNPGNNEILSFSILIKKSKEEETFSYSACITQEEFWYQGKYNSSHHWNRILVEKKDPIPNSYEGITDEPDSLWVTYMCDLMQNREQVQTILKAYVKFENDQIAKYGE